MLNHVKRTQSSVPADRAQLLFLSCLSLQHSCVCGCGAVVVVMISHGIHIIISFSLLSVRAYNNQLCNLDLHKFVSK